nr:hypothetical protein [Nitrospirota bacterium]
MRLEAVTGSINSRCREKIQTRLTHLKRHVSLLLSEEHFPFVPLMFNGALILRKAVLLWVMLWMVVIPLVHIHPETDHHHGDIGHTHGGTAHTVFSSDLPCEYATHHSAPVTIAAISHVAHDLDHPEIGFSLAVSGDRPLGKAALAEALSSSAQDLLPQLTGSTRSNPFLRSPQSILLLASRLSRAPPRLVV